MVKLIISDWDDVITLGSKEGYFHCYHLMLLDLGVHLDPEEEVSRILKTWGKPFREVILELLREDTSQIDKACELFEKYFFGNGFIEKLSLIPGTKDLLIRLSKKYKLAVATGQHSKLLKERIIPEFNIPNVFEFIYTSDELADPKLGKPHPHMIETILEKTGVDKRDAVFVGDAENDVLMAKAAGVEPIVVLTGHLTSNQANKLGVSKIIEDVTLLETVL